MKGKKFLCGALALLLCFACFVGCGPSEDKGGTVTVTYDYNYEGAPAAETVTIEESDVAPIPDDPKRDLYTFTGWYADAACSSEFDFEEALYEDVTIYAGWKQSAALVTFDYNYDGADPYVQQAEIGKAITQPADPKRDGYTFTGWYTTASCETEYDFSAAVTGDLTVYAGWEEVTGDTVKITWMWNYEGAPDGGVCNETTLQTGRKATSYAAVRDGYYLKGWYTDAACTQAFDFNQRVEQNCTLYARWFNVYTFEAEYTDFTGVTGSGYSGGGGGLDNVVKDTFNAGASNGFYVTNMYCYGSSLTFNIEADAASAGETVLVLRLSAEYFDMTITDEMYTITVNGEKVSFDDIVFSGVPDYGSGQKRAFADYTISKAISLREGENVIRIEVTNSIRMQESGTLNATAPMVDCLRLYTDAGLSWTEKTSNIENK